MFLKPGGKSIYGSGDRRGSFGGLGAYLFKALLFLAFVISVMVAVAFYERGPKAPSKGLPHTPYVIDLDSLKGAEIYVPGEEAAVAFTGAGAYLYHESDEYHEPIESGTFFQRDVTLSVDPGTQLVIASPGWRGVMVDYRGKRPSRGKSLVSLVLDKGSDNGSE